MKQLIWLCERCGWKGTSRQVGVTEDGVAYCPICLMDESGLQIKSPYSQEIRAQKPLRKFFARVLAWFGAERSD